MRRVLLKTVSWSLAYLGLSVACLIQWNSPHPWSRIDWFTGTYFALRFLGSSHSVISSLGAFRSKALRHEWWAMDSDPQGPRWVMVLMALDLLVFFDYGHWRLALPLSRPAPQTAGVGLYLGVTFWQIWTDSYLARYFSHNGQSLTPMNYGPYRYVRHPRYAAAIIGKVAMALTFASIFGWLLALAWGMLLINKISIEEKHLRKIFGSEYESYARITAKVLPGIY